VLDSTPNPASGAVFINVLCLSHKIVNLVNAMDATASVFINDDESGLYHD
jgi:hypothetical protein